MNSRNQKFRRCRKAVVKDYLSLSAKDLDLLEALYKTDPLPANVEVRKQELTH